MSTEPKMMIDERLTGIKRQVEGGVSPWSGAVVGELLAHIDAQAAKMKQVEAERGELELQSISASAQLDEAESELAEERARAEKAEAERDEARRDVSRPEGKRLAVAVEEATVDEAVRRAKSGGDLPREHQALVRRLRARAAGAMPDQRSTYDQLQDVHAAAVLLGLYDAADVVARQLERMRPS